MGISAAWVLVRLGDRVKKLFIGRIDTVYYSDGDLEVSFLRRKGLQTNVFVHPKEEDCALVDFDQIVGALNQPQTLRRGLLKFAVDASEWIP